MKKVGYFLQSVVLAVPLSSTEDSTETLEIFHEMRGRQLLPVVIGYDPKRREEAMQIKKFC